MNVWYWLSRNLWLRRVTESHSCNSSNLSRCQTVIPSTIVPCITVSLYHYITVSLYHCTTVSLHNIVIYCIYYISTNYYIIIMKVLYWVSRIREVPRLHHHCSVWTPGLPQCNAVITLSFILHFFCIFYILLSWSVIFVSGI